MKTLFVGCRQVDNRDSSEPKITQEQAAKLCDRNFGVGADGVIFAMPGVNGTDYTMRIFNSDGSEPEVSLFYNDMFLSEFLFAPLKFNGLFFFLCLVDVWQWSQMLCKVHC